MLHTDLVAKRLEPVHVRFAVLERQSLKAGEGGSFRKRLEGGSTSSDIEAPKVRKAGDGY